ncbi:MAG: hypothetical protein QXZ09_08430 [Candidatus Methanomethylicaceae archaeon]
MITQSRGNSFSGQVTMTGPLVIDVSDDPARRGITIKASGSASQRAFQVVPPGGESGYDFVVDGARRLLLQAFTNQLFTNSVRQYTAGTINQDRTSYPSVVLLEQTTTPAEASDAAVLYSEDTGAGKTRLVVRWPGGATQVLATEP